MSYRARLIGTEGLMVGNWAEAGRTDDDHPGGLLLLSIPGKLDFFNFVDDGMVVIAKNQ